MVKLSLQKLVDASPLGMVWGFPSVSYAAQIKAAETGNPGGGMATLAIRDAANHAGSGCVHLLGSADRRSQLFRLGGWITLTIGLLTAADWRRW